MKKLNLLYALLFAVAIVACKDDDESPSFKKEDFVGSWSQDDSDIQGCISVIKFDATKYYNGEKCDNGDPDFDSGTTFTFDGKQTFTVPTIIGETKMVILSKTATTFKADIYWVGTKIDTYTYTKL